MSDKSLPDQEDGELAQLQATWQSRLDAAGAALDQFEPPAYLFDKIEARIQSEEKQRATRTIRADFGVWEEIEPGVQKKTPLRRSKLRLAILPNKDGSGRERT